MTLGRRATATDGPFTLDDCFGPVLLGQEIVDVALCRLGRSLATTSKSVRQNIANLAAAVGRQWLERFPQVRSG
jgi:hypothetical protein